jgi:AcrR family transcriptional regulator
MNIHSAMVAKRSLEGDKREAILEAALNLFAERGFHGTAVPLVAEQASVGAGTIYRYFPSKEALVNALFRQWKRRLAHALMDEFPFSAPPRAQFHVFWDRILAFAAAHPSAFAFLAFHHHRSYLDAESLELENRVLEPALAFFEQATAQEVVKPMPAALLFALVWGAIVGIVQAEREFGLVLNPAILGQAETCCWEAIRR